MSCWEREKDEEFVKADCLYGWVEVSKSAGMGDLDVWQIDTVARDAKTEASENLCLGRDWNIHPLLTRNGICDES